jgi:hypothetical protein
MLGAAGLCPASSHQLDAPLNMTIRPEAAAWTNLCTGLDQLYRVSLTVRGGSVGINAVIGADTVGETDAIDSTLEPIVNNPDLNAFGISAVGFAVTQPPGLTQILNAPPPSPPSGGPGSGGGGGGGGLAIEVAAGAGAGGVLVAWLLFRKRGVCARPEPNRSTMRSLWRHLARATPCRIEHAVTTVGFRRQALARQARPSARLQEQLQPRARLRRARRARSRPGYAMRML